MQLIENRSGIAGERMARSSQHQRRLTGNAFFGSELFSRAACLAHLLDDLLESLDFSHFFKPEPLQISR
jgi:hypothetical protein